MATARIGQLNPLTTALDSTALLEISQSDNSYRITVAQLRDKYISTDGTLIGESDLVMPSEKAVKTYVDNNLALQNEHNELLGLQGGDSTSLQYYHLIKEIYDQITSNPTAVIFSDNIIVGGHAAFGSSADVESNVVMNVRETGDEFFNWGYYALVDNTTAGGYTYGIHAESKITAANGGWVFGVDGMSNYTYNTGSLELGIGTRGIVAVSADNATITDAIGVVGEIQTGGGMAGTSFTRLIAGQFQMLSAGSGDISVTDGYGILVKAPSYNPSGTTTNLYGLYIEDQLTGGFVNTYNIYSAGATAENFIDGNLDVGGDFTLGDVAFTVDGTTVTVAGTIIANDPTNANEVTTKSYVDNNDLGGQRSIVADSTAITVNFATAQADDNFYPVCSIENTTDVAPSFYSLIITNKTVGGFTVEFDSPLDSGNYKLNWKISR